MAVSWNGSNTPMGLREVDVLPAARHDKCDNVQHELAPRA